MASLRMDTNKLINKEAALSLMKQQISVVSHGIEPSTPSEMVELFGHQRQRGWDGIHFHGGPSGPKKFFDSISSVIALI